MRAAARPRLPLVRHRPRRRRARRPAASRRGGDGPLFVLGFGAVFVAFGAGAAWFGTALLEHRRALEIAGGVLVALAGLVYLGAPLPRALLGERRVRLRTGGGPFAAAGAGAAFAVAWTPCVGPTLGAILTLAAATGGAAEGAVLLGVFSLGLGMPFLAFGLGFTRALALSRALRRRWRLVSGVAGALLVAFGILLAVGWLGRLTAELSRYVPIEI